jgi:hypothetical protein
MGSFESANGDYPGPGQAGATASWRTHAGDATGPESPKDSQSAGDLMRQPGVDRACPLAQIELRKELLVHRFQGCQDIANYFISGACDPTERFEFVKAAAELEPGRIRQIKRLFERDCGSAPRCNQTQPKSHLLPQNAHESPYMISYNDAIKKTFLWVEASWLTPVSATRAYLLRAKLVMVQ